MKARLFCKFGHLAEKEFDISDEATIGANESNSIVLKAETISGNHARFFLIRRKNIISQFLLRIFACKAVIRLIPELLSAIGPTPS